MTTGAAVAPRPMRSEPADVSGDDRSLVPLALLGPVLAVVGYRLVLLVARNLGTRLDLVQLLGLAAASVVLLVVAARLLAVRVGPARAGFGVAVWFFLIASPFWSVLGASTGSRAIAIAAGLGIPLLVSALFTWLYQPTFRWVSGLFLLLMLGQGAVPPLVGHLGAADQQLDVGAGLFGDPARQQDMVVLVLDEYARSDVLESEFGFDNGEFEASLAAMDIVPVPRALANYTFTVASVPSMMTGSYPVTPGQDYSTKARRQLTEAMGGDNPMVRDLQSIGYRYTHIESPHADSRCVSTVDECVSNGLFDETTMAWLQLDTYLGFVTTTYGHPFPRQADEALGRLRSVLEDTSTNDDPDLVFAHVLAPHFPYTLDADCEQATPLGGSEHYPAQIQCINDLVLEALDGVVDDTVVVVTGDHGWIDVEDLIRPADEWSPDEIDQRLRVFSAAKLGQDCAPPADDATLAVIMHHALACALGLQPEPPVDRAFLVETFPLESSGVIEVDMATLREPSN